MYLAADSPAPAEPSTGRQGAAAQALALAPIRVPRNTLPKGTRQGSLVDSFSFGNRPEEEVRHQQGQLNTDQQQGRKQGRIGCALRLPALTHLFVTVAA